MALSQQSPHRPTDVVIVGSYVHDHVWLTERFPETGETLGATGFAMGPGGKGFNQAVACRRQGAAVAFVGAVGNDVLGRSAREFAAAEGFDSRWLVHDERTRTPTIRPAEHNLLQSRRSNALSEGDIP